MTLSPQPRLWRIDKLWRPHRSVVLDDVRNGDSGLWAQIATGAEVVSHDRSMTEFPHDAVVYFPFDQWWSATFMPGVSPDLHVDIGTPCSVDGDEIHTTDLDLDVTRSGDQVAVLDRAEFEAHQIAHSYPERIVKSAEEATMHVANLIAQGRFPFDGTGDLWRSR